ncbi:hypothetical protein [Streptacidiphilus jiangxiensis]|uniref:Uncharacterized protein n=1 Tax=Streptacidiphilus jiangxiensis TaxID=235985 RepID=A0A1H7WGD7_STRJI|nr:hypothetical protein [Streptacidiphilus jiangxiensis]SEM20424.1 hypothetical protein SAMN05414137_120139 [Streptacidiphilus jiangxiensis]
MEPREDHVDPAVEAGRARFRTLPQRIRLEDTFVSVPASTPSPGRDSFDHDEWLARNAWCGSLL